MICVCGHDVCDHYLFEEYDGDLESYWAWCNITNCPCAGFTLPKGDSTDAIRKALGVDEAPDGRIGP